MKLSSAILGVAAIITQIHGIKDRIYVYDWPDSITDRWPITYDHHRLAVLPKNRNNYGIGAEIDASIGLYDTYQYSLFTTFYNRLLEDKHSLLTTNPNEASLFFIPYDLGMDSSVDKMNGGLRQTNCPMMETVAQKLLDSKYFKRYSGNDHVLIHSINQPMYHFVNQYCATLYKICSNCTKLSIDTYKLFKHYTNAFQQYPHLAYRWYSIPFPSSYHVNKLITHYPWKYRENDQQTVARKYLIAFMGTSKVTAKKDKILREKLIDACRASDPDTFTCLLLTLPTHQQQVLRDQSVYDIYSQAVFCLMPGGDFPTRKGVLDAILSGCIPVTFLLSSAQNQWPWHWGTPEIAKCCVYYIRRDKAVSNVTAAFEELRMASLNKNLIQEKRKCISDVGHRMQYNHPHQGISDIDAFDIAINRSLALSYERIHGQTISLL